MHPRRTFLKAVAGAAAGWSFAKAADAQPASTRAPRSSTPPAPNHGGLTAYAFASRIWVRIDGRPFTCYRADLAQKYPYFFPLAGPATGLPMTDESGEQYPHHRSLFLACDRVNGGNYWQEELNRGQIVARGPKLKVQDRGRIVIIDQCDWRQPDKEPVIEDRREWTLTAPEAGLRLIDADITLTARTDIHIDKTNHAFFSVRADRALTPAGGGKLLNSKDQAGEKATFGQTAEWCGFSGTRCGKSESIVIMDHPANPWSPCKWFTRDYGFMSPTPFYWFEKGWDLPAGQSVRLRYRVVALAGDLDPKRLADLYGEFAS